MEFRLLGPVEIEVAGNILPLPRRRDRGLLGVLLLELNRAVPVDRLAELLWDGEPPARARRALHGHVSRLRAALAAADGQGVELATVGDGYRMYADPQLVDAHRFRALVAEAATADLAKRVDRLRAALDLWRGRALDNAASDWLRARICADLQEQRLLATEQLMSACLALCREQEILPDLARFAGTHPERESMIELHMRALYQASRKADALDVYHRARTHLADELGLDPSPALRELHQAILRDQLTIPTPPATVSDRVTAPAPPPATPVASQVPRQLPAPPTMFTGRAQEISDLDRLHDSSTVVITAIDGMAGVGKTALAVHWAHRVADRFTDGQLFLDLHGFTKALPPVEPADALDRLLRALGVPGERIPIELDDRTGLWRSVLAGRQMLIVLDNAATEAQVGPLLPGTPGCQVLVTSRRRLAGLDVTELVSLDTLPVADAITLFTRAAGRNRLAAESPQLVAEAAELCGRLPLAIRVATSRLKHHASWDVAELVARLHDQDQRLDELADPGDGGRSIAAALEVSYQQLTAEQRRLYLLLGLHPGPNIEPYAAAALADTSDGHVRRLLDQLLDAHLLDEPAPGRYVFHDLLRARAAQTAATAEPEPNRRAALGRLLDSLRHTASVAMDVAYPAERERRPRVPPARNPGPDLPSPTAAVRWLDGELPNLLAAARHAAQQGWPEHTGHLSAILHRHLCTRGRYRDAETLHHRALTIARVVGDRTGELHALHGRGTVHRTLGRHERATDDFSQAWKVARAIGNRTGEVHALHGLGTVYYMQGRYGEAIDDFGQAWKVARAVGYRAGEMHALHGRGTVHRTLGRHEQAVEDFGQALEVARAIRSRAGEMHALHGLGFVHRLLGQYGPAADDFGRVFEIARSIGDHTGELQALHGLGTVHRLSGRYEQAADRYQQVLDMAQQVGDRNWQFEASYGLGRVHQVIGNPDTAAVHLWQALQLATDLRQPADQARAHDGLARVHQALSQHERAGQHWQHALDILAGLAIDDTDDEDVSVPAIRAHLANLDTGRHYTD